MTIDIEEQESILAPDVFPHPGELDEKMQEDFKNFDVLLQEITTTSHQLKSLWKLIFENANTDRKNAYIAFVDLYIKCHGSADKHAINSPNISKYLERMEKSNTQLLKLAELVEKAMSSKVLQDDDEDDSPQPLNSRDLFSAIEKRKRT